MVPPSFAFTASALAWLPAATTHNGPLTMMPPNWLPTLIQLSSLAEVEKVTTSRLSPSRMQPPSSRANNVGDIEANPVQPMRDASAEGDGGLGVPPPHDVSARPTATVPQTSTGLFIVSPFRTRSM